MSAGILLSLCIWFGIWGLIWDKSDLRNNFTKLTFIVLTVWSVYIMCNGYLISKPYIIIITIFSLYLAYFWKTEGVINLLIKIVFTTIFIYGVVLIFTKHLI